MRTFAVAKFYFASAKVGDAAFPQFPQFEERGEELSLCHPERSEGFREHQVGVIELFHFVQQHVFLLFRSSRYIVPSRFWIKHAC